MRKKRWLAPVWGMLAAAAFGQPASAQPPASPLDGPFPPAGPPVGPPMAPPPGMYPAYPTYTPIAPDAASPAGYPPQMEAWPTISPYDHALDTTYNDRGIWFREMLNEKRRYRIDAEFISARFRQPGNITVGHVAEINTFDEDVRPSGVLGSSDIHTLKDHIIYSAQGRYFDQDADGTIDIPVTPNAQIGDAPRPIIAPAIQSTGNTFGDGGIPNDFSFFEPKTGLLQVVNFGDNDPSDTIDDSTDNNDEIADTFLYPVTGQVLGEDAVTTFGGTPDVVGEKRQNNASPGMRLVFGLEDEDESGFDWTGYWINGEPTVFRRGLDDPDRPRLTNIVFFDAPWLGPGAVEVLDYNVLFQLRYETEMAGTDLAFYHTPMVDFGWFRMRPLYGARYDYLREAFNFTGKDNGTAFVYDADGDISDEEHGGGVLGASVLPNTVEEVGDPGAFILDPIFPYQTNVTSKVRSHLYGPQIGFDMQAGGENLMLTAVTKAGILANTEKLTLDAEGFGTNEGRTQIRPVFSDAKTHTHVSPFLEFKTSADINVFPIIPYVNRWQFLKNARLRAGWTTLVVGNLSRPMDNIVWRSETSGGPYIKDRSRDHWYTQYWDIGVHWNF